jgi:membrane-bound serine protease (ClpP class)
MYGYLKGTIADAQTAGATVLIELDTPGALGTDAEALAQQVYASRVPVVVWVGPPGARAAGAGLMLVYAASASLMSPGSTVGPLSPLDLAQRSTPPGELATAQASIAGWARAHGTSAVPLSLGKTLSAQQAVVAGVTTRVGTALQSSAPVTLAGVLDSLDGLTVQTASGPVVLHTKLSASPSMGLGATLQFRDLGPWARVLHAVDSPAAIYVLLVLGLAGIAFEPTQPGIGMAGIAGAILVALSLLGMWSVHPWWPGLLLIVVGTALMEYEVLSRRLGLWTALGIVAFVAGSFTIYRQVAPSIAISPWLIALMSVAAFLYYGFALTVAMKSHEKLAHTQRGLIGLLGETRSKLDPEGSVQVKGVLWRGRAIEGPIPAGSRVRVRGLDGVVLQVKVEPDADVARGDEED